MNADSRLLDAVDAVSVAELGYHFRALNRSLPSYQGPREDLTKRVAW